MMDFKIYRIRHRDIGLFSKGGTYVNDVAYTRTKKVTYPHWTKYGKIWQSLGPLKNHLNQYMSYPLKDPTYKFSGNDYSKGKTVNNIPDTWIIEEYDLGERVSKEYLAKDLMTK